MAEPEVYTLSDAATPAERRFHAVMMRAVKAAVSRNGVTSSKVRAELVELRRSIIADLALIPPDEDGSWQAHHLAELLDSVNRAIERFENQARLRLRDHLTRQWQDGLEAHPQALERARVVARFHDLDDAQLRISVDYSASLIKHISATARADIDGMLRRAVLGRIPTSRVALDIQKHLDNPRRAGYGPLWYQADRIVRTEGMRIFNLANWARVMQLAQERPDLQKRWRHGGGGKDPRPYHQDVLDGQTVGWKDDFTVIDPKGNLWKAFGPHDPGLPAGETINCTCHLQAVLPEFSAYDPDYQSRVRSSRARYQLEWIQANRPDLLTDEGGLDWLRQYRPEVAELILTRGGA